MARQARDTARQPRDLLRMRERLDGWRSSHSRGVAFPEKLWSAAGRVARRHGVYVTARALCLEYNKLKAASVGVIDTKTDEVCGTDRRVAGESWWMSCVAARPRG